MVVRKALQIKIRRKPGSWYLSVLFNLFIEGTKTAYLMCRVVEVTSLGKRKKQNTLNNFEIPSAYNLRAQNSPEQQD
jgi:hypothetical protein